MSNDLGKVSLWASITGFVLPAGLSVLTIVVFTYFPSRSRQIPEYVGVNLTLSIALFALLELIGLGFGIAARRTATGKAGLVISAVLLILGVAGIVFLWWWLEYGLYIRR
jgi:hypothetical protein